LPLSCLRRLQQPFTDVFRVTTYYGCNASPPRKRRTTKRGLRPQPKEILSQRHRDTKKGGREIGPRTSWLRDFVREPSICGLRILPSIQNLRRRTRFEQVAVRTKERTLSTDFADSHRFRTDNWELTTENHGCSPIRQVRAERGNLIVNRELPTANRQLSFNRQIREPREKGQDPPDSDLSPVTCHLSPTACHLWPVTFALVPDTVLCPLAPTRSVGGIPLYTLSARSYSETVDS
jgi:hypothetical protein